MSSQYFVTTSDPVRRATWNRIFDTDVLPIMRPRPSLSQCLSMAYRLDAHRLTDNEKRRLAGYLVLFRGMDYNEALSMIQDGYPIQADGCDVIEQALSTPAFLLPGVWRRGYLPSPNNRKLHQNAQTTRTAMRSPRMFGFGV